MLSTPDTPIHIRFYTVVPGSTLGPGDYLALTARDVVAGLGIHSNFVFLEFPRAGIRAARRFDGTQDTPGGPYDAGDEYDSRTSGEPLQSHI